MDSTRSSRWTRMANLTWPEEHDLSSSSSALAAVVSGGRHDAQVIAGTLVEAQVVQQPVRQRQLQCGPIRIIVVPMICCCSPRNHLPNSSV